MQNAVSTDFLRQFERMILKDHPGVYKAANYKLRLLRQEQHFDVDNIPVLFGSFCDALQIDASVITCKRLRTPNSIVETKRIFIAMVFLLCDPFFLNGYADAMAAGVRLHIATMINTKAEWISNVAESVRFEYFNLDTFRMRVDLLASCMLIQAGDTRACV